jgi:hypothetical protein
MSMSPTQMSTPLQCKMCGADFDFDAAKCPKCNSRIAIAKSQFETDQMLRSRLDGGKYFVHFGKLEEPGPQPESHRDEQE